MVETIDTFYDQNKLYIKSVRQEAALRMGRRESKNDTHYEDIFNPSSAGINSFGSRQMYWYFSMTDRLKRDLSFIRI